MISRYSKIRTNLFLLSSITDRDVFSSIFCLKYLISRWRICLRISFNNDMGISSRIHEMKTKYMIHKLIICYNGKNTWIRAAKYKKWKSSLYQKFPVASVLDRIRCVRNMTWRPEETMQRFASVFDLILWFDKFWFCYNHFREQLVLMSGITSKYLFIVQKKQKTQKEFLSCFVQFLFSRYKDNMSRSIKK